MFAFFNLVKFGYILFVTIIATIIMLLLFLVIGLIFRKTKFGQTILFVLKIIAFVIVFIAVFFGIIRLINFLLLDI
jgi:hypothetical protein